MNLISRSVRDTRYIAKHFSRYLYPGLTVGLSGTLGSGKTQFVRGLTSGLNCRPLATSPTFKLKNVYHGKVTVFHLDFYRLATFIDLESIGFYDYQLSTGVMIIEWPDKFLSYLPQPRIDLKIQSLNVHTRKLIFTSQDKSGTGLLHQFQNEVNRYRDSN